MKAIDFGTWTRQERALLIRFVCSFAWADSEIRREERAQVERLARSLGLEDDEACPTAVWLDGPPDPSSDDPLASPCEHRTAVLPALLSIVTADQEVCPAERAALGRFLRLSGREPSAEPARPG